MFRLREKQEVQEFWLGENRDAVDGKLRRGVEQLQRGEGIPEDQLDAHLAKLKKTHEGK
jgi:hypothetical protein